MNLFVECGYATNMPLITKIPDSEGGGFCATLPGCEYALVGDGQTEIEARRNLNQCLQEVIGEHISTGTGGECRARKVVVL